MTTLPSLEDFTSALKFEELFSESSQSTLSTLVTPERVCNSLREIRRRNRKNNEQVNLLIREFELNPYWNKEKISGLAQGTGLSEAQVYKWNWDYKKKNKGYKNEKRKVLMCRETIAPSDYDKDILIIQKLYKMGHSNLPPISPSRYICYSEIRL
jgi:hypothetical protein